MGIKEVCFDYEAALEIYSRLSDEHKKNSPYLKLILSLTELILESVSAHNEKKEPTAPEPTTPFDGCPSYIAAKFGFVRLTTFVKTRNISGSTMARYLSKDPSFKGCGVKVIGGEWYLEPYKTLDALQNSKVIMNRMKKGIFEAAVHEEL